MRLAQYVPCVLLCSLALGCSDDSDSDSTNGPTTMGSTTMGSTTNGPTTMGSTTMGPTNTTSGASNTTNSSSGSTTGGASNVPPDGSAASITAFLEAEGYKDTGWRSVYASPNPPQAGSPHGTVMVYLSPVLNQFILDNPDSLNKLEDPAVPGVMAVKELYEGETVVGKAVTFYPDTDVIYYCYGPDGRCNTGSPATTPDTPLWGDSSASPVGQCNVCHSGLVFTGFPENQD